MQSNLAHECASAALRNLRGRLIRITNDLRLLSSVQHRACGASLPALQPGLIDYAGEVNPVMAELTAMVGSRQLRRNGDSDGSASRANSNCMS